MIAKFTPEQEQVVMGTLLGNGSLRRRQHSHDSLWAKHREVDREYIFWKYEVLKSSGIFMRPPFYRPNNRGRDHVWIFQSRHLPILSTYRELFYPNGKKAVTREILDKLDLLGLAVWYMDNGSLQVGLPSQPNHRRLVLCTECFTCEENTLIRDWLEEKFGFNFLLARIDAGTSWRLRLTRRVEVERFVDMLRPYAVPCMGRSFRE